MNIEWPPIRTFELNATTIRLREGKDASVEVLTGKGRGKGNSRRRGTGRGE